MQALLFFAFAILNYYPALGDTPDNPYGEKSEKSKKFFFELLPDFIRDHVRKNMPDISYITSCKGDFNGDGEFDYLVSTVSNDRKNAQVTVFVVKAPKAFKKYPIDFRSAGVALDGGEDDYIESYCVNKDGLSEHLPAIAKKLAKNVAIVQIKSYQMNGLELFFFDPKLDRFLYAGGVSAP
jgi:hypothetical protein